MQSSLSLHCFPFCLRAPAERDVGVLYRTVHVAGLPPSDTVTLTASVSLTHSMYLSQYGSQVHTFALCQSLLF